MTYSNRLIAMRATVARNTVARVLWKNPWMRHKNGIIPSPKESTQTPVAQGPAVTKALTMSITMKFWMNMYGTVLSLIDVTMIKTRLRRKARELIQARAFN